MGKARVAVWVVAAAIGLAGQAFASGEPDSGPAQARSDAELSPTPRRARPTGDEWAMLYLTSIAYGGSAGMFVDGLAQHGNAYATASLAVALTVPVGAGLGAVGVAVVNGLVPIRRGVPQTVATGILLGLGEGLALDEWSSNRASTSFHTYTKDTAWIFGTATVGLVSGIVVSTVVKTTPGRASWVATTGLFGGVFAGSIAGALSPQSSFGTKGINAEGNRAVGLTAAIAGLAGAGAGLASATALSPSSGRVHLIDLGWMLGTILPGAACAGAKCNTPGVFGAMAVGGGVGFVGTFLLTMGMRQQGLAEGTDPFQGVTPYVSPTAGGMQFGLSGPL